MPGRKPLKLIERYVRFHVRYEGMKFRNHVVVKLWYGAIHILWRRSIGLCHFSTLLLKPQPLRHFWCIMIQHDHAYDLGLICFLEKIFQYCNVAIGLTALDVTNVIWTLKTQFIPSYNLYIQKRHKTTVV